MHFELFLKLFPLTVTFLELEDLIRDHHGRAVLDVSLCLHRYHADEVLRDLSVTLAEKGVESGSCVVYYDFSPVTAALLD